MKQPKVSVITVNYNGRRFLKDFFASLESLCYQNREIIFFDNNSRDGSVGYVRENHPQCKIVESKKNLGFAVANNQAVKQATGKYLFFLNNDTKIDATAVSVLVEKMEEDPRIGIGGCRMMTYHGETHLHTGIGMDIFGYPMVWPKTFYIEGSALMIRKKLFEELGGFDAKYFMFHEDIDLAWRVWLSGYQVRAFPKAVVYHYGGGVAGGSPEFKEKYQSSFLRRYQSERNNIRTLLKNYQGRTLTFILPLYLLINLVEILLFLITLKFKVTGFYLKAYRWNLANLGDTFEERKKVQGARKVSDKWLMKKMYLASGKFAAFRILGVPEFK